MRKAFALAALAAGALFAISAAPASADGPLGGCPVGYTLTAISDIAPAGQAGSLALDQRGNNDGYICLLPFPGAAATAIGAPYNGIDNRVEAP